jgi:hydroxypyruvate isomerase
MPKIDLCIEPFFLGSKTVDKIIKANKLGFNAVEFWFWDHEFNGSGLEFKKKEIDEIASVCEELNVTINDIVVNSPDGSIGGFLTKPEDRGMYLDRLKETIDIARKLKVRKLITCTGNEIGGKSFQEQFNSVVETLSKAADIASKANITLVLEALNSHVDHAGYFLVSSKTGFEIIKEVNSPNLKLLYDVYHMQIMEGNHIATIQQNSDLIGHYHSAGVPGRNEIYKGEINYLPILEAIDYSGYDGYFGLEYWPSEADEISLTKTLQFIRPSAKVSYP